jgi:hypothetical protein
MVSAFFNKTSLKIMGMRDRILIVEGIIPSKPEESLLW